MSTQRKRNRFLNARRDGNAYTTLIYLQGEEPRSEGSRQQVNGAFATFAGGVKIFV